MKTFRLIVLILVVFIFELSYSQSKREINSEQLQKRGDGLYYAVNEEKSYTGKVVEFYENGQKRSERSFKDGKRQDTWNFWTKDGHKLDTDIVTDIDGNTYLTIKIGDQWWMIENLKVTRYRNGDSIPNVTDEDAWSNLGTGAYCDYDNTADNAETYGHLYNWYAVNDPRGLAPEGWHVPSDAEWGTLVDNLGGRRSGGSKMKDAHWGTTNESGFSALPGGCRFNSLGFLGVGCYAFFWSSTFDRYAWARVLNCRSSFASEVNRMGFTKGLGFSVRCVRD